MNPPIVMTVVRYFFELISVEVHPKARGDCLELCRFLSELSVCDYYFTNKKPSHTALACILTAFEGHSHDILPREHRQKFADLAWKIAKVNCTVQEVHESRLRLRDIYQKGQFHKPKPERSIIRVSGGQSPDNVSRRSVSNSSVDENSTDDIAQNQNCMGNEHMRMSSAHVHDELMDEYR